jgi:hypothetical protein
MPDWTYLPLRGAAERVAGPETARHRAMGLLGVLGRTRPGRWLIRSFDLTTDLDGAKVVAAGKSLPSPCGLIISTPTEHRVAALRAVGFGFVGSEQQMPQGAIRPTTTDFHHLVALARSGTPIILNDAAIEHGPTIAQRINEVLESDGHQAQADAQAAEAGVWWNPLTWFAWTWAMWLGIAMICGGIGAALITGGPVLLGYDRAFLKADVAELEQFNQRVVLFLQHDRVTMAGCMAAIGCCYIGHSQGMRRGWPWARAAFLLSGAVGFPTFFLFLGYGFFDPLHFAVAVGFFPLYLMGCFGRRVTPTWVAPDRVDEPTRRRAAVGQLLMVSVALGVLLSGVVIMVIGVTNVLIPSDRGYLGASQTSMEAAFDGRLLRFVAHDRAGFGGALTSLGVAVLGSTLWGWRHGLRSTFWSVGAGSAVGFGAALAVHWSVGYIDVFHLLPVYLGLPMVGVALLLSREWLLAEEQQPPERQPLEQQAPECQTTLASVSAAISASE